MLCLRGLARHLRGEADPWVSTAQHPFGAALHDAVRRSGEDEKNAWLRRIFTCPDAKDPKAKPESWNESLFNHDKDGQKVTLDLSVWRPDCVQVFLNNQPRTEPADLDALADRIEGKQPPPPLQPTLDLLVREPATGQFTSVTEKPSLLPVKEGDELQLRVRLDQPAYVCLAWLDQQGRPFPMFPWTWAKADWNELVLFDERSEVAVPEHLTSTGHSDLSVNGPPGVETLVLMVSRQQPAAEVPKNLGKWLAGLAVPKGLPTMPQPFRQTYPRRQPGTPAPATEKGPMPLRHSDPLRALHDALGQRLAEHFDQTLTYSFPNAGPPPKAGKGVNK